MGENLQEGQKEELDTLHLFKDLVNSEFAREGNRHNSMLMTEAKLPGKAYIKIAMKKKTGQCAGKSLSGCGDH